MAINPTFGKRFYSELTTHALPYLILSVIAIAAIALSTQNLRYPQLRGIGHLGSNILLGGGSLILLLELVFSCARASAASSSTGKSQARVQIKMDVHFDVATLAKDITAQTADEAERVQQALTEKQYAFCTHGDRLYIMVGGNPNKHIFEATPQKVKEIVENRKPQSKDIFEQACRLSNMQPLTDLTPDTINAYKKLLYPGENFAYTEAYSNTYIAGTSDVPRKTHYAYSDKQSLNAPKRTVTLEILNLRGKGL